jgi:predicted neuraminidase
MSSEITLELRHRRNNPRNSEGAFITLADGRIMFAFSRYYGSSWSDVATATISARFSSDEGKTWTKRDKLLVSNEGGCNVMSPSLLRLRDGRIALFYLRTNNFLDCRMYLRTSGDDGKSWSEPTQCIHAPGYFVVNNDRVIQLKSGRIIIPAAYHRPKLDADPGSWDAWDFRAITLFYYSDDEGQTWRESRDWWSLPVYSESGMQEPGVIERKDGHLYAWARTDTGRQWETWSFDSGVAWTPPRPSRFQSPNSSLSMKRIDATGDLLAIWNDYNPRWNLPAPVVGQGLAEDSSWGRTPLVLALSDDEGKSWKNEKLVEDDPRRGFCYTAIHSVEGSVLLAYCCGGVKSGVLQNLCIRRITLDWLYGRETAQPG